jgi:hypothetical protein
VVVVEGSGMRWNDREGRDGKVVERAFSGNLVLMWNEDRVS